jgi:antitoxin component YwqK of YwqJK toxin-antitoxin module
MKLTLSFIFFLISSAIIAQIDTMIVYYKNGHLKSVTPKLNGKQHGKSKMWYESGKIWSEGTWNNGNLIQSTMYYENGKKSYFVCKKNIK